MNMLTYFYSLGSLYDEENVQDAYMVSHVA